MGTRNLTFVKLNDGYPVRQYFQYDGYPEGLGIEILDFLKNEFDERKFKKELSKLRLMDSRETREFLNKQIKERECSISYWDGVDANFPELHSDGATVLELIQKGKAKYLEDGSNIWGEEWTYIIDLDSRKLVVFDNELHFNDYDELSYEDVYGRRATTVTEFDLDNLPKNSEFLEKFKWYFDNCYSDLGKNRIQHMIDDYTRAGN